MTAPNDEARRIQAREAIEALRQALESLRERVQPRNPELFAVMAETYETAIARIETEVTTQ